jgi:hypothetical protein
MKLDYAVTLADWKAAIRLHMRQKLGRRIHLAIFNFVIPVLAVLGLGYIVFANSTGQSGVVDELVMPVTVLVLISILIPIMRNFAIRKSFKGMFPPSETGPGYSLDIDNERILSVRPGSGEAKYFWTGICGVAQDNKITLLYISDILFLGIPTRVLSPADRTELYDLIARNVVRKQK